MMAREGFYKMGSFYRVCDLTGFTVRAEREKKMWTNTIRRTQSWEPRQPQDFVKGVRDDQTVPEPRPRQLDQFQGPLGTTLIANFVPNPIGPWFLSVYNSTRFLVGDTLNVMTDLKEIFKVKIIDVPNINLVQVDRTLNYTAASGNIVINVTAESDPIISEPWTTV